MATDLTNLTADIGLTARAAVEKSIDLAVCSEAATLVKTLALAFGTGANKANQVWHDRSILAPDANDEIDLAGYLHNAFGATITFANLKALVILNRSDEVLTGHAVPTDAVISYSATGSNFLGPVADNTDVLLIPPGGIFLATNPTAAGWLVTPDTGDIFNIVNEDSVDQAIYDLFLIGESA